MNRNVRVPAVVFFIAMALTAVETRAAFITNGGFDTDVVAGGFAVVTPSSAFQITGWSVVTSGANTSASVDVVRAPYWQAQSGQNSIDLFGTGTQQPSFLAQTFSVGAGQTGNYNVSFWYSVNTDSPQSQGLFADVVQGTSVGGVSVATSPTTFSYVRGVDGNPSRADMQYRLATFGFAAAAAGDYTLWFVGNQAFGNANQGAALDSVSIDAAVVPLPGAAWLMLAGL
ncbi:MAG: hypothetical protein H7125_11175, partial [Proteobacteria bacterium]|nr:hypothetical protein [Burkholderiales bacterium]